MNKLFVVVLLFASTFFFSCRRQPVAGPVSPDTAPAEALDIQEVDFNYLVARSRINFKDAQNNLSATANVRICKDSLIWVSVIPAFGIEAARALITTDSIFFTDRINGRNMAYDYETLSNQMNFGITFNMLQSVFIGNMPLQPSLYAGKVMRQDDVFVVRQRKDDTDFENFVGRRSRKLERVVVDRSADNASLELNYGQFAEVAGFIFPHESIAKLAYRQGNAQNNIQLNINYSRIELRDEPLEFPYIR
jgi:hypothetical protein